MVSQHANGRVSQEHDISCLGARPRHAGALEWTQHTPRSLTVDLATGDVAARIVGSLSAPAATTAVRVASAAAAMPELLRLSAVAVMGGCREWGLACRLRMGKAVKG